MLDVRLEWDEIVKDISSTPFFALGEIWVATLKKKKDGEGQLKHAGIILSRQRNRDRPPRFGSYDTTALTLCSRPTFSHFASDEERRRPLATAHNKAV